MEHDLLFAWRNAAVHGNQRLLRLVMGFASGCCGDVLVEVACSDVVLGCDGVSATVAGGCCDDAGSGLAGIG